MSVAASDLQSVAAFLGASAGAFADLGVRWYLFGAQAAFFYGASRLTVDVDITVALERCSAAELAAALLRHGIRMRVDDEAFVEQTRVLPVVHVASRVVGDIVLAGPGLEEGFLERAIVRDVLGVRVPVAAAEDLVVPRERTRAPRSPAGKWKHRHACAWSRRRLRVEPQARLRAGAQAPVRGATGAPAGGAPGPAVPAPGPGSRGPLHKCGERPAGRD